MRISDLCFRGQLEPLQVFCYRFTFINPVCFGSRNDETTFLPFSKLSNWVITFFKCVCLLVGDPTVRMKILFIHLFHWILCFFGHECSRLLIFNNYFYIKKGQNKENPKRPLVAGRSIGPKTSDFFFYFTSILFLNFCLITLIYLVSCVKYSDSETTGPTTIK